MIALPTLQEHLQGILNISFSDVKTQYFLQFTGRTLT